MQACAMTEVLLLGVQSFGVQSFGVQSFGVRVVSAEWRSYAS